MEQPQGSQFRRDFHVCIVGAGIVGLAGAILLRRHGFHVTVLERDETLRTIGAGIQLHPNAVRVLDAIGVWDKIRTKSVLPGAIVLKAYNTGQVLHSQDLRGNQQRYGAPLATVHRGQLREILYAEVMAQGIKVRHGINVDVANIDLSDGTLTLSGSGEIIRADLFVGADGGKSPIRQALVGRREMVPHGKIVNRILVDEAEILKSPRLRHLIDTPNCVLWLGPESKAVTYGLDGVFNIAFTWPWSTRPEDAFSSYQTVDLEDFKAQLGAWEPDLQELIGLGRGCLRWMLVEPKVNDEGTPWVSEKSNFCLVGDSAHSLLPYLAQGAAMGLESISVLAHLLGKTETTEQVAQCLQIYQEIRKERTGHVNRATLKNGRYWQMPDGPQKEERDRELMNDIPTAGFPNLLADPFFQQWLWGFDASEAAEQAWLARPAASQ